jgi:hypothetical protein
LNRAKDGESLAAIAEGYGFSVEDVARMNAGVKLKEDAGSGQLSLQVDGPAAVSISAGKYAA